MSAGLLTKTTLPPATNVTVFTITAACTYSVIDIIVLNKNTAEATVSIALSSASPPAVTDYIEYQTKIPVSGGKLEITDLKCSPGELVIIYSDVADVNVRISGIEYTSFP